MTLRIEKVSNGQKTVIKLSGRLQSEYADELKIQMSERPLALDLDGVTLVDLEMVRFLNDCEKCGVELLNCQPYVREWITREEEEK